MSDHPQLKTPGEILAQAREGARLTLDQLAERTKIPLNMLRAIELDEYHKISGDLYVRSFLRTYAVDVGVDPERVLAAYLACSGAPGANGATGGGAAVWEEEVAQVSRVGLPWGRLALALAALVVLTTTAVLLGRGCADRERPAAPAADAATPEAVPDSLAFGRGSAFVLEEEPAAATAAPEPAPTTVAERAPDGAARARLPVAYPGDGRVVFSDGRRWPVVLRLRCDAPLAARVKRDGERTFGRVEWPAGGEAAPALPGEGVVPGRAYAVRQGLAVYWGAEDHFSLRLDRVRGVEISVNGVVRDLSGLGPDEEFILDAHAAGDAGRP